jgi:hypothetical protein
VTVNNGSGRRRKRFGPTFGRAVGRTSPAFHAIRGPALVKSWRGEFGRFTVDRLVGNLDEELLRGADLARQTNRIEAGANCLYVTPDLLRGSSHPSKAADTELPVGDNASSLARRLDLFLASLNEGWKKFTYGLTVA